MKILQRFTFLFLLFWIIYWPPIRITHAQSGGRFVLGVTFPVNMALAPPTPLPQGSCVSQAPAGTHGITVCWIASASSTVTGYNVYVSTTTGGPYTRQNAALVSGTSFFYATPNLGGVKQFIVIRSFDGTTESANSTETSATAIGNPLPPTGPQAVAADLRWRGAAIVRRREYHL